LNGNFCYTVCGEVTPAAILTKCRVWGDMVDVIICATFRDCRLRAVGVVRGVSLPSPIDLTRRPCVVRATCDGSVAHYRHQPITSMSRSHVSQ